MALIIKDGNGVVRPLPLFDPAYRACATGLTYTTAKDILQIAGPATTATVVRVKQVRITMIGAAVVGDLAFTLVKRSTLTVTGSATTAVPLDINSPTATATVLNTLSGTVGTSVGIIGAVSLGVNATAGTVSVGAIPSTATFTWTFTDKGDQPPLLRLATDALCVNVANGGTTPTAAKITVEIAWDEAAQ